MQETAHGDRQELQAVALTDGASAVAHGLRRASVSPGVVGALAALVDAAAIALGIRFAGYASAGGAIEPRSLAILAASLALGIAGASWALGVYRLPPLRRFWPGAARLLGAVPSRRSCSASIFPPPFSSSASSFPPGARGFLAGSALDFGLTERRAVIVGGGERGARVDGGARRRPAPTSGCAASSTTATTVARRRWSAACRSSERSPTSSASCGPPRSTC